MWGRLSYLYLGGCRALCLSGGRGPPMTIKKGDAMITSVLARKRLRTGRGRPERLHRRARKGITRAVYTAVAAGIALAGAGFAGAGSPARAASQAISPPAYSPSWAGYSVGGRWFRFLSTTVTVPSTGMVLIGLSHGQPVGEPFAELSVSAEGGLDPGGVVAHVSPGGYGTLPVSPRPGDQLTLSMFYDQHGHDYFTATDTTRHVTGTVRLNVGSVVYDHGFVVGPGGWQDYPPPADTQLLKFTGSRVTTYRGDRGTLTGPWATWPYIATTTGNAAGTVEASPSALSGGGADFGVWLRAVPVTYTTGFAGYDDGIGPFRFVSTTVTVPTAQTPPGNGGTALVGLLHNGGATPRPYAEITVKPGGGAGSIGYASNNAAGAFNLNPAPGDRVRVSVFYDQKGHNVLTAADTTRGTTQTVTIAALAYAGSMPLNSAVVDAMFDNSTVVPPPADAQIWQFTGSVVTTYRGDRGTILGPWTTSRLIDTTDGTRAGAVVADASVLPNEGTPNFGRDFGVWLRHR
jgi:hypothetical protein